MEVRRLRQVLAIHEYGSFAKAADALNMSQPSLSRSVARLEDELRAAVFVRSSRGAELTPLGELLVARAERIVDELTSLARDAALSAGGEAGQVRLGVGTLLGAGFLPEFLDRILERHPRLRLSVETGDADDLLPQLAAREIDLVLCAHGLHVGDPPLIATRLLTAQMVVVAAPDHPLAGEQAIAPARLARFRCAGAATSVFRNDVIFGLADEDGDDLLAFMANDYRALLGLAEAGRCALVAPSFVARTALAERRLVRLDVAWSREFHVVSVCTRAGAVSPIIGRIIALVRKLARELEKAQAQGHT
jgi:DNA-binding transcriptional LysR family regulator